MTALRSQKKVALLESQIEASEKDQDQGRSLPEDRFVEHMRPFLEQAKVGPAWSSSPTRTHTLTTCTYR